MKYKPIHSLLTLLCLSWGSCSFITTVNAQTHIKCNSEITDADGYKIWQVKVDARYAHLTLPEKGTPFTRAVEKKLLDDVRNAFRRERNRENEPGATLMQLTGFAHTQFELNAFTTCVREIEPEHCRAAVGQDKCVNVTVDAKSLRFSPDAVAQNLLGALPRSDRTTLLSQVPKPLLTLNPKFGLTTDRAFGPANTVELNTNLLDLPQTLRGEPLALRNDRLDFHAAGRKSLSEPFYETALGLAYKRKLPSSFAPTVGAEAGFTAQHQPLGEASYLRNALVLNGNIRLTTPSPLVKTIDLSAGFRRSTHRLFKPTGLPELTSERAGQVSAVLSGQIAQDFWRLGMWYEHGSPEALPRSYQRVAGLLGYAKEFGRGNQTVGVELLVGAGRAWGSVPRYAQFFGGNMSQNFLYDANPLYSTHPFPMGPVMRSFGSNQLKTRQENAVQGANSYAHFNLSVALPIPQWSRPLIPNEQLEIENPVTGDTETRHIRQIIKNQARSGEALLKAIYKKQGIANAEKQASKEFRAINSALNFLVDRANLYAIKPLLLLEAARLNRTGELPAPTRWGIGAGLQFTVTIAKFEAGYVFATRRQPNEQRGNFMLRLYFQNLF